MRMWGVEDLDFGLKSWLMGHPILHDPEAVVGHRFRASFDNYDVPVEHTVVNQLRMARKNFTPGVWAEWLDRCRLRHPGRLADRPEGLWARVWELFEEQRPSVEQERAYLHARRQRDEFWYAERFGLTWPRLHSASFVPSTPAIVPVQVAAPEKAMARAEPPSPSPSPCPPPCPTVSAAPAIPDPQQGITIPFGTATISPLGGSLLRTICIDPNQHVGCDCGCGCGDDSGRSGQMPICLVYNSGTINVQPIIQVTMNSCSCTVVPSQIQAQLTFNGIAQGWITFGTSGHSLGDVYALPLQVANPIASSGLYPWSVEIKATFNGVVYDRTASGVASVVVNNSSSVGAGWSLGGIPALQLSSGGVAVIDNSTGGFRYFSGTGPTYVSPPNDQGTLVQNGDGTFTYTAKDQTKTNFDGTGRMTSQVDAHGLAQTLAYSGSLLSTITQPDGGVTTFNYNGNQLASIQLPGGRTLTPGYDANNNLTSFVDAAGGVSSFGYDSSSRMVSEQVGPLSTSYTYSPSNGTLTQVNRGLGTMMAVTAAAVQGLGSPTAINASQAVVTLTDGLNHTTSYLLDTLGRPLQTTTADGAVQSWTRNAAGDPTAYTDPLNRQTLYAYNLTADLTQITYPDGTTTNYQYELTFHQVTQVQDALGNLTKSSYDPITGDLLTQTDALNNVTAYTWANGLKQTTKDALGNVTTLQWDSVKRRQTAKIDALGSKTTYSYDAAGNQSVVQDALNHSTTSTFDGNRRLLTRTNALGGVLSNTYDAAGNVLTTVDELGRTTSFVYDQRGLQTSLTEAVGTPQQRTTNTAYDAAGNVLTVTDALGDVTRFGYDAVNRQVSVTEAYGTVLD
jgi:YD repeat-containing protein